MDVRRASRHALLAYAMLRGRPYGSVETHAPDEAALRSTATKWFAIKRGIEANLKRFGGLSLVSQIDDWLRHNE